MSIRNLLASDRAEWLRMRTARWPDCSPGRHLLEMEQLTNAGRGIVFVAVRENGALCSFAEVAIRHDHVDGASSVQIIERLFAENTFCDILLKTLEVVPTR